MPSLEDYGTNIQDTCINLLYDDLYHIHMDDEKFIYWVKSGENWIISGEYFDESESDENWLYAFAELCYDGDISVRDVIRLFVTDTENFEEDEKEDSDNDSEEDDDDEDWDLDINASEFITPKKGGMWLRSMRWSNTYFE